MVASPPPPRQKSCGECSKSKRRCDLRTPACTRCRKRNLPCRYLRQPLGRQASEVVADADETRVDGEQQDLMRDVIESFADGIPLDVGNGSSGGDFGNLDLDFSLDPRLATATFEQNGFLETIDDMSWGQESGGAQATEPSDTALQPDSVADGPRSCPSFTRDDYHMRSMCVSAREHNPRL